MPSQVARRFPGDALQAAAGERDDAARRRRTGNALPKRVTAFVKEGRVLSKEARGLGRAAEYHAAEMR